MQFLQILSLRLKKSYCVSNFSLKFFINLYLLSNQKRLDERNRERNNANRMFDSENNDRGGYNVGNLYYTVGSILDIEW